MNEDDWGPGDFLAFLYTLGFLLMVAGVMYLPIPEANVQIVNTLVTIMSTIQIGIGKCYYDRSKADSAAQKQSTVNKALTDAAMIDIAKAAPAPTGGVAVTPAPATPDGIIPAAEVAKPKGTP